MFREFNVKFEDVEMLGGADNILEGTEVTKVIMRGHNKMSSLNSALKNCKELDIVDGELDLNGVENINEILEDTPLVKKIDIKNINNENISTRNAFNNVDEISIGGDLYNKKALQNVLASKEWTFEGFKYKDEIGENITTKEVNVVDNNKITIQDTLEQKAKGIEIEGQTYENLINGEGEINLIDELTIESIDGNKEFNTTLEQEVCVEVIEGETYQNLVNGNGEYKLTDTFSTTWTENNSSIDNAPSIIEIPEIWGNTVQGFPRAVTNKDLVNHINGLGFSNLIYEYVNDKTIKCTMDGSWGSNDFINKISNNNELALKLKPNTKYSFASSVRFPINSWIVSTESTLLDLNNKSNGTFTTSSDGLVAIGLRYEGEFDFILVEGDVIPSSPTFSLEDIKSVGDLYVDENGEAILDEEGNEQYKLEIESSNKNLLTSKMCDFIYNPDNWTSTYLSVKMKPNTKYTFSANSVNVPVGSYLRFGIAGGEGVHTYLVDKDNRSGTEIVNINVKATTVQSDSKGYIRFFNYFTNGGLPVLETAFVSPQLEENAVATDYVPPKSNKTTILMPCQLMKVSDGVDRILWDVSKNKYIIEKNVRKLVIDGTNDFIKERSSNGHSLYNIKTYQNSKPNGSKFINDTFPTGTDFSDTTSEWMMTMWSSHLYLSISDAKGKVQDWFANNPTTVYYHSTIPEIVETEILEKPALETYSPTTHISTNSEVQPSQMAIVNKQTILSPLSLQANTDYTLQLDSTGKDNKNITVNLGGTETTIQPTDDTSKHHKVVVRTPATLTNETLELSGEGIIINDIMLFEGGSNVIKQDVSYIDGIESIGELQGDGTYKIDILTSNSKKNPNASYCEYDVSPFKTSFNTSSIKDITVEFAVEDLSDANIIKDSRGVRLYIEDTRLMIETFSFDEGFGTYTIGDVTTNDLICLAYENQNTAKVYVNGVLKLTKKTAPSGVIEILCKLKYLSIFTYKLDQSDLSVTLPSKSSATIYLSQPLRKINNKADKLYWDRNKEYYCIEKNVDDNYEVLNDNIIIDLPNLNKKYVLNSYNSKTCIEFSNLNLKPSRMLLESDIHKYNVVELKANEKYTIQFNCIEKGTDPIKINLDNVVKNVDPTLGLNHVNISTESISGNLLKLSGSGNKISDIMLVKGEMNQYPEYFNDIQNVGELQDDGSYKIDIKTNEGYTLSVKSIKPLEKGDKLYWNKSNKRYEIDRNGIVEVPTITGDIIDLPRLYQRDDTNLIIESGNIKPAKTKIVYKDII